MSEANKENNSLVKKEYFELGKRIQKEISNIEVKKVFELLSEKQADLFKTSMMLQWQFEMIKSEILKIYDRSK